MRLTLVAAAFGAGCVLLTACATPKPDSAAAAAKPERAAHNSGDQLICRSVDVTGSRMPQRECHTASEWARTKGEGLDQLGVEAQRSAPSTGGN